MPPTELNASALADFKPTPWALRLGYSGLLPFVALSAAAWKLTGTNQLQAQFALAAYGATIVSFLGAIHWGLALRNTESPDTGMLVWGVVPSLLAWVALLMGGSAGLWLLAGSLWACFAVDRRLYPRFGLRGWLGMRLALTVVASASCIAAAGVAAL